MSAWVAPAVGDRVEWMGNTGRTSRYRGVVVSLDGEAEARAVDELMNDEFPGRSSWAEFGPLARIRCDDPACQCAGDWKHAANASQLTIIEAVRS